MMHTHLSDLFLKESASGKLDPPLDFFCESGDDDAQSLVILLKMLHEIELINC